MRRLPFFGQTLGFVALLGLIGLQTSWGQPPAGKTTGQAEPEPPVVTLLNPAPRLPVFGQVEIRAAVRSDVPLTAVTFEVDGVVAGRLEPPPARQPYRLVVDLGEDNRGHRFEVIAEDADGRRGSAVVEVPPIRVDFALELQLQEVYVTVDRGGRRVLDLDRGNFEVLDDGAPQRLVTFARGDVPFTALLLVDASSSMHGDRLAAAVEGASRFARGMGPLDQAKVLLYSDRLLYATPFTSFAEVLTVGLQSVVPRGATALNDHLYMGLKLLEGRPGRKVVVLLSDGVDTASVLDMQQVLPLVRRGQAQIYWIRLGAGQAHQDRISSWRDLEGHRREVAHLQQAVETSGGRIVPLDHIEDAPQAFQEILTELREQYVLGYYPTTDRNDGRFHEVKVKVRAGYEARAAAGYVDF